MMGIDCMYKSRSLFKRVISIIFIFIFVVAHPMQVFATGNELPKQVM